MSKENFLPPKGTRDIEPLEAEIRSRVINIISESYKKYGFNSIETPSYESLDNLIGKKGGENEKLIFKILKRGQELKRALENNSAAEGSNLADFGLRYDLTIPLARYYANYKDKLPKPFKVFQIGNVWRAERPQKSRYRQFTQCDIDIIGDPTPNCEAELIYVIYKTLEKLNIGNFKIRINDRNILKSISEKCGIKDDDKYRDFLISLDKLDKKPLEEILEELRSKGFAEDILQKIKKIFTQLANKQNSDIVESLKKDTPLNEIIGILKKLDTKINIEFDPALVRGMDYYTGTIFEVQENGGTVSFGGGGRYNNMVGSFSGQETSACGFSLGFERIMDMFFSDGKKIFNSKKKAALIYSADNGNYSDIIAISEKLRDTYSSECEVISVLLRQKNLNNQLDKLKNSGFTHWFELTDKDFKLQADEIWKKFKEFNSK